MATEMESKSVMMETEITGMDVLLSVCLSVETEILTMERNVMTETEFLKMGATNFVIKSVEMEF